MRHEFAVKALDATQVGRAEKVAEIFSDCLDRLEAACGKEGREMALVRTKLQEASHFATDAAVARKDPA